MSFFIASYLCFSSHWDHFSLRSLSTLITIVLNSASGVFVAYISFNSLSGDFSCSFILGNVCFLTFCLFFFFVSVYYVYLLWLPNLLLWLYFVGIFWDSVAQSSSSCELDAPGMSCVSYVYPSVAVEPWMLLAHLWVGLTFRLADYKDQPQLQCMSHCAGAAHQGRVVPSSCPC